MVSSISTRGEIITSEDGRTFANLSAEAGGDRHMVMALEAPSRA